MKFSMGMFICAALLSPFVDLSGVMGSPHVRHPRLALRTLGYMVSAVEGVTGDTLLLVSLRASDSF